jgi:signal transduction histidine kinase
MPAPTPPPPLKSRWDRASTALVRGFHTYGNWLVGISWKRFFLLAVLLLILAAVLQNLPPFSWRFTETISVGDGTPSRAPRPPHAPTPPTPPRAPSVKIDKAPPVSITIDQHGVRIAPSAPPASAASAPGATASGASPPTVEIRLPPGADSDAVREAVDEARQAVVEAIRDNEEAQREAERERRDEQRAGNEVRTHVVRLGDFLPELAMLWIVASAIMKITYKGRLQAEVQAQQAQVVAEKATETAEAESLKRQVVEARMAAMQAQVEPHFLFNTLASIDHLIETDPPRASKMQKNLIALLRASMPTMREASDGGVRDLGREIEVVRPYVEILKVRMEERLASEIDVPEGLLSAEFPPMMIQTLVENAIRHGLEPKPEGGQLKLKAEVVHGRLVVSVTDTGVGLTGGAGDLTGKPTGTGVGLANIRERLTLLYGARANLTVVDNPGGGTRVTITVPYKPVEGTHA